MPKKNFIVVALLSITLIGLEMVWTRIFSAEFFYTFAFLTLSLAVMGLGMGALALRLFRFLENDWNLGLMLAMTGLAALVGPPVVLKLGLKFSLLFSGWAMIGKFIAAVFILSSSFFFGGIALAMLFKKNCLDMPRLYMADLIGAGIGVFIAMLFMNWFSTPSATFIIAIPVLLASLIAGQRWFKTVPLLLVVSAVVLSTMGPSLLHVEREERAPVIYRHWDAMGLVKIYDFAEDHRGLNIDHIANSPVYGFDGNWDRPDSLRFQFGIPVDYLIKQFDSCTFLSLGAGGGVDVLQALQEGATEIHAVEINPHVNKLMLDGELAEFTGNIYHDPRVKVVTDDARTYVRSHKNKFDVIYSLSSNTFAAVASGSFALAENYLFTTEAFEDYWQAMTDSGFMMMEHQFYMPRLVGEVMTALENQGVEDITSHFAIYDLPQLRRKMVLLSKRPLTDTLRYHAIIDLTPEVYEYIHLLYPAPDSLADNLINRIVQNGWQHEADTAMIDISPCTDDRPFVAQMGLWKNFQWDRLERVLPYEFYGFPLSKIIIIVILLIMAGIVIPLNLIPYLKRGDKLRAVPWLYFFTIGMAFMIVEVVLIQKYTFFVGPSVYSIATILLTLLIASGVGSRFSNKVSDLAAFGGVIVWLLLDILVFKHIIYGLTGLTMLPRILITALLIFPLGFFMGMPFPKGALRVKWLIDWGFAVNGAASVVGSAAIILISVSYGFTVALLIGAGLYLAAFILMAAKKAW